MRILHFFKTYWPDSFGGIERTIHSIATGTQAYGVETEVLSLSKTPETTDVRFDGHHAAKARLTLDIASTGLSYQAIGKFAKAAAAADIVHYHYPWPFMDLAHFLVRHGKPSVVTYHSDVVRQKLAGYLYAPLRDRFLNAADAIIATSPNYLATSPVLNRFAAKTHVIPIGLDQKTYEAPTQQDIERWKQQVRKPFFLFVGEFRYYKALDILMKAAPDTNADILLIGAGPQEAELRHQAAALGAENVKFLGRLDDKDKAALLQLSAGLVFPSNQRSEAFGLSLVEASMFGKAMISCEIGTGTSYVNKHGETGLVVPPSDPKALAAAMNQLAADSDLQARFGTAARRRFEQLFTTERMVAAHMDLYRQLLK